MTIQYIRLELCFLPRQDRHKTSPTRTRRGSSAPHWVYPERGAPFSSHKNKKGKGAGRHKEALA